MEPRTAAVVFAAEPRAPSSARRFVGAALSGWGRDDLGERALLAVSELVTNAFLHGEGDIQLHVALGSVLRVEVYDTGAGLPVPRFYSPTSTTGRGLHLVGSMTDRWGTDAGQEGKAVWFEIDALGTPGPMGTAVGQ